MESCVCHCHCAGPPPPLHPSTPDPRPDSGPFSTPWPPPWLWHDLIMWWVVFYHVTVSGDGAALGLYPDESYLNEKKTSLQATIREAFRVDEKVWPGVKGEQAVVAGGGGADVEVEYGRGGNNSAVRAPGQPVPDQQQRHDARASAEKQTRRHQPALQRRVQGCTREEQHGAEHVAPVTSLR